MAISKSLLSKSARKLYDALDGLIPGIIDRFKSGSRSAAKNKKVGGAKGSQHLQGNAIDIDLRGLSDAEKKQILDAAIASGVKGFGIYNASQGGTTLHVDTRKGFTLWSNDFGSVPISTMPSWAKASLTNLKAGKMPISSLPNPRPPAPGPAMGFAGSPELASQAFGAQDPAMPGIPQSRPGLSPGFNGGAGMGSGPGGGGGIGGSAPSGYQPGPSVSSAIDFREPVSYEPTAPAPPASSPMASMAMSPEMAFNKGRLPSSITGDISGNIGVPSPRPPTLAAPVNPSQVNPAQQVGPPSPVATDASTNILAKNWAAPPRKPGLLENILVAATGVIHPALPVAIKAAQAIKSRIGNQVPGAGKVKSKKKRGGNSTSGGMADAGLSPGAARAASARASYTTGTAGATDTAGAARETMDW